MTDCAFCAISRGDAPAVLLDADDRTVAFMPRRPAALGHALVIPRGHYRDVWDLTEEVAADLSRAVLRLAGALRAALVPDGLNIINSAGSAASQTVFHLHVHLIPRWHGDSFGRIWPVPPAFTPHELQRAAALVRASLG